MMNQLPSKVEELTQDFGGLIDLIEEGKRAALYPQWHPFAQGVVTVAIDLYRPGQTNDELNATRMAIAALVTRMSL